MRPYSLPKANEPLAAPAEPERAAGAIAQLVPRLVRDAGAWVARVPGGRTVASEAGAVSVVLDGAFALLPPSTPRRMAFDVVGPAESFASEDLVSNGDGAPVERRQAGPDLAPSRLLWARALMSGRLLVVPRSAPAAAPLLLSLADQRAGRVQRRVLRLLRCPAERRVHAELRELAERFGVPCPDGCGGRTIPMPITQDLLAELTGGARETVNRALRSLTGRGVAVRSGLTYTVFDEGAGEAPS